MGLDMHLYSMDKNVELNIDDDSNNCWYYHAQEVCYWRKFNALHKWFVDNVQNGIDKCEPHVVTEDHLHSLIETLKDVYKTQSASKLPPQSGFFFGSTEIDQWYWDDVKESTVKLFRIYMKTDWDNEKLVYSSSW